MTPATDPPAAPAPAPHRVVRFELTLRSVLAVLLVVAGLWVLARLVPVLLVLVAALLIVGALNPVVAWLERRKIRRSLALALVFGLAGGLTLLGLFLAVPPLVTQVHAVIEHEPEIRARVVRYLQVSPVTWELGAWLEDLQYGDLLKAYPAKLLTVTFQALEIVAYAVAAVFLALYMMIDRDRLRGALFAVVPRRRHLRFSRVLLKLETIVGGYIRGQILTCLCLASFLFTLLLLCHVPNALALAVFGGVMDVLPYLGALLTILPAAGAAYAVGPGTALTVLVVLLLYEEFESRVLVPLVYGRALRLPPSFVFFSLLVGGMLAGIAGALLALPLAAAVLMLLDELRVPFPGEPARPGAAAVRRQDERGEQEYEMRTEAAPIEMASAIAVEMARGQKDEEDGRAAERKIPPAA